MSRLVDLTGQRIGRLVVLGKDKCNSRGRAMWECRCDCGKEIIVRGDALRSGKTKSCGCLQRERTSLVSKARTTDLTGQKFGRLLVLERAENSGRRVMWCCLCDCGKETIVRADHLRSGAIQSCGCLQREASRNNLLIHGGTGTRLFTIWRSMHSRCYQRSHKQYKDYGGRGITICDEWLHDFAAFQKWASSHGYQDDLTIDRIDNDKGYSPENCRWVTMAEQNRNKRPHKNQHK